MARTGQSNSQSGSMISLFCRVYWMALGNIPPLFILIHIALKRVAWPSLWDGAFVAGVVLLAGVRYLEITSFNGQTSDGEPADFGHWVRYSAILSVVMAAGWGAARGIVLLTSG